MKKYVSIFYYANFVLAIILILSCSDGPKLLGHTKTWKTLASYGEDTIELFKHEVGQAIGNERIQACQDSIMMDSTYILTELQDDIPLDDFKLLRDSAQQVLGTSYNHVLALKIAYGYDSIAHQIVLFYQPLYLKRTDPTSPKLNAQYDPNSRNLIYEYIHGVAHGFKISNRTALSGAYKRHITIKHPGKSWFDRYNGKNDLTGNVRSIVFSFQEFDQLLEDNTGKSSIKIYNSAEDLFYLGKTYLKHNLLLGYDGLKFRDFYLKYGNLSHLCPPSCDTHKFDLK